MKNIILISLIALFVLPSNVYAWGCKTHQYICDNLGLSDLDCCIADDEDFQKNYMMSSHHNCLENRKECVARYVAGFYMRHPEEAGDEKTANEIIVHLLEDSMSPTEWYQFTDEDYDRCYTKFQDKVDAVISSNGWSITEENCHTKDGMTVSLVANQTSIERTMDYVALNLDITTTTLETTTTIGEKPIAKPNMLQVIIEMIINFFKNLFGWV